MHLHSRGNIYSGLTFDGFHESSYIFVSNLTFPCLETHGEYQIKTYKTCYQNFGMYQVVGFSEIMIPLPIVVKRHHLAIP